MFGQCSRGDAPEDLEWIILRCLESDPGQRYPDVDRLLTELEILRA